MMLLFRAIAIILYSSVISSAQTRISVWGSDLKYVGTYQVDLKRLYRGNDSLQIKKADWWYVLCTDDTNVINLAKTQLDYYRTVVNPQRYYPFEGKLFVDSDFHDTFLPDGNWLLYDNDGNRSGVSVEFKIRNHTLIDNYKWFDTETHKIVEYFELANGKLNGLVFQYNSQEHKIMVIYRYLNGERVETLFSER